MPYFKDTLIARRGYSGAMGAWADTVGQIGEGFLTFFGNRGQAAATQQPVVVAESGPSTAAIAVGAAAVGGALWLLLRKRRG